MTFRTLQDSAVFEQERSEFSIADAIQQQKEQASLARQSATREFLAGTTFGLSSLLASPFMSEEKKQALLDYKIKNPLKTAGWEMGGALVGALFTGGFGLAKSASAAGTIARAYETMQGLGEAKTVAESAKAWSIGASMMTAADIVDTASLDPSYVVEHAGTYAGDLLLSAGLGAISGAAFKGLGIGYNKFIKGENGVADAELATTMEGREYLGSKLAKAYTPYIGAEGELNTAYQSAERGDLFTKNTVFLDNLERETIDIAASLGKGENVNPKESLKAAFLTEVYNTEELGALMGSGKVDAEKVYKDWMRSIDIQRASQAYFPSPDKVYKHMHNTVMNTIKTNAADNFDKLMVEARGTVEQSLVKRVEEHFTTSLNNVENSPDLAKLTNPNGLIDRITTSIDRVRNPQKYLDPADPRVTPAYRKAVKELSDMMTEDPRILRELEGNFKKFTKSITKKESGQNVLKDGITPRLVYDEIQSFRQGFNSRMADLQKKLTERFVIGNPAVDKLWGEVKGELFQGMKDIFGEFGEMAARKSELLETINRAERDMLINLTGGKQRVLPSIRDAAARRSAIGDAWGNLSKVGESASFDYKPEYVEGWLKTSQSQIKDAFDSLHDLLPNAEIKELGERINNSLELQSKAIKDIAVLNDPIMNDMFQSAKEFTKKKAEKIGHGLSIPTRFSYAAKDFIEGLVMPQAARYGWAQVSRMMMDLGSNLGQKLLQTKKVQRDTAQQLLYNSLLNVSEMSVQKTRTMRAIEGAVSNIMNLGTLDRLAAPARSSLLSYDVLKGRAEEADNINRKFQNIQENLQSYRQNPAPYVQRIDMAMNRLRSVAPSLVDDASERVTNQMAYLSNLLPDSPDGYYKPVIPLSEKARFLDRFEAITNPNLMLNKIGAGTISKEQLEIMKVNYPDIWSKTMSEVRKAIYEQNPPPESRSRVYSYFGLQDVESFQKIQYQANQMLMMEAQAKMPKSKVKQQKAPPSVSKMTGFTTPQPLAPSGVPTTPAR